MRKLKSWRLHLQPILSAGSFATIVGISSNASAWPSTGFTAAHASSIVESSDEAKPLGQSAWQMQGVHRGYELLGRHLGMFHDKLGVSADDKIMQQLMRGTKYAAGLTEDEDKPEEQEPQDDSSPEPKPN